MKFQHAGPNDAWGRNGAFKPDHARMGQFQDGVYMEVYSKRAGNHAPILIRMSREDAGELAHELFRTAGTFQELEDED